MANIKEIANVAQGVDVAEVKKAVIKKQQKTSKKETAKRKAETKKQTAKNNLELKKLEVTKSLTMLELFNKHKEISLSKKVNKTISLKLVCNGAVMHEFTDLLQFSTFEQFKKLINLNTKNFENCSLQIDNMNFNFKGGKFNQKVTQVATQLIFNLAVVTKNAETFEFNGIILTNKQYVKGAEAFLLDNLNFYQSLEFLILVQSMGAKLQIHLSELKDSFNLLFNDYMKLNAYKFAK